MQYNNFQSIGRSIAMGAKRCLRGKMSQKVEKVQKGVGINIENQKVRILDFFIFCADPSPPSGLFSTFCDIL